MSLAVLAAVIAFPGLALIWQVVAERQRPSRQSGRALVHRFALRSLAVGLVVLAVSLANLGGRRLGDDLAALFRRKGAAPSLSRAETRSVRPSGQPEAARRHELESFVPADARVVVALSDPRMIQQLLPSQRGGPILAALEKCQIAVERALVLVAARDRGTRMVVLRAPGITDQRNLYCLVGFLGKERLDLRITSDSAPMRFEVQGLLPGTLRFEAIDQGTVLAADGSWADLRDKSPPAAPAPLAPVLERVDRGASLWSASVAQGEHGRWDLALDARFEGNRLRLRGSSVPPSGEDDRAEMELRIPTAFASALPAGVLRDGVRGVLQAIAAVGAGAAGK
jgi:hypothetical protein